MTNDKMTNEEQKLAQVMTIFFMSIIRRFLFALAIATASF
jgi:hypothetical protein